LAYRAQKKRGDDQKLKNDQKLKKIIDRKKMLPAFIWAKVGAFLGTF